MWLCVVCRLANCTTWVILVRLVLGHCRRRRMRARFSTDFHSISNKDTTSIPFSWNEKNGKNRPQTNAEAPARNVIFFAVRPILCLFRIENRAITRGKASAPRHSLMLLPIANRYIAPADRIFTTNTNTSFETERKKQKLKNPRRFVVGADEKV